ncbi:MULTISPECIES: hypothetical protein [unclassified Microbacterium]|uniref:hypothetical protein n=1 Tax=unclassified Microbacterium TaxID=2609290 RepID=UPI0023055EEB|nr:hypothetical protein [Microbacterium sp. nov. GSS16]MEE2815803.1 hypothetical protein [Actinomycetota bacterium]WCD93495.1 hypothetical protein PGB26_04200 [Microbacterium sp. nov. GSS16]
MNKSTIWTIVAVVVSVVIAFWIVNALFSLIWFIAKLAIVAVVALIVFVVIRSLLARSGGERR